MVRKREMVTDSRRTSATSQCEEAWERENNMISSNGVKFVGRDISARPHKQLKEILSWARINLFKVIYLDNKSNNFVMLVYKFLNLFIYWCTYHTIKVLICKLIFRF